MPLLDGRVLAPMLIAFAVIGLLGAVLRWTFSNDVRHPMAPDSPTGPGHTQPSTTGPSESGPSKTGSDDFGLLSTVATVDTLNEATQIRALLDKAGIRATTSIDTADHHRVLVFPSELDRARRVCGG